MKDREDLEKVNQKDVLYMLHIDADTCESYIFVRVHVTNYQLNILKRSNNNENIPLGKYNRKERIRIYSYWGLAETTLKPVATIHCYKSLQYRMLTI